VKYYASILGANLLAAAFLATAVIFGSLAFYARSTERDFSFLGGFLFAATLGLVVLAVASLFIKLNSLVDFLYGAGGVLIFSGWILYDVSQYRQGVAPEEMPYAVLNLYLDLVNLFLFVLRLLAFFSGRRD